MEVGVEDSLSRQICATKYRDTSLIRETAFSQDLTVEICLGPYGGPRWGAVAYGRGTPKFSVGYFSLSPSPSLPLALSPPPAPPFPLYPYLSLTHAQTHSLSLFPSHTLSLTLSTLQGCTTLQKRHAGHLRAHSGEEKEPNETRPALRPSKALQKPGNIKSCRAEEARALFCPAAPKRPRSRERDIVCVCV